MKKKVCMVVPSFTAKGGITSVVNGYRNSQLTEDYDVRFIETYCDGSVIQKTSKALSAYLKFIYFPNTSRPDYKKVYSMMARVLRGQLMPGKIKISLSPSSLETETE